MADFKKQGGSLTGREERYDGFEGEPRAVGGALGGSSTGHGSSTTTGTGEYGSGAGTTGGYGSGPAGSGYDTTSTKKPGLMDKLNPKTDSGESRSHLSHIVAAICSSVYLFFFGISRI